MAEVRIIRARFFRGIDRRSGELDRIEVMVDRGLKSGKVDVAVVTAEQARVLAAQLLIAAERADGRRVDVY